ncbi:MAG: hypothetical protein ACR2QZ_07850 [Woeseiaceae bacterium]
MARPVYFLLIAGAIMLAAACGASESARPGGPTISTVDSSPGSLTLMPGVVIEPTRDSVYLMNPEGGIDALKIADGSLLWNSSQADQPLFVEGDRVLAIVDSAASGLTVAFLDPAKGTSIRKADEPLVLPLPAGVDAAIDQTLERKFTHAVRKSGGETYLTWDYLQRGVTGVAPPGGRAPEHREHGAFRYIGGTLEAVEPESIVVSSKNWPAELQEQVESKLVRKPPLSNGRVFAITEQRYDPHQVVLSRWRRRDGMRLEEKLLYDGRAVAVLASCNEHHVVVATTSAQAGADQPFRLRYYEIDSGALVAELQSTRSAGPFCLLGSRLLQLSQPELRRVEGTMVATPLALVAVDIATGAELWRRVVRDTAFRGPAPPGS